MLKRIYALYFSSQYLSGMIVGPEIQSIVRDNNRWVSIIVSGGSFGI
jgi:hypothetical protein